MATVGIICEYNPFHNGHLRQLQRIREAFGAECAIVCLMSGNYVQRGAPAILDKSIRAKAAVLCGADLVLELPVEYALSSAEGFAAGGVSILSRCCDALCFGTESLNRDALVQTARALCSPAFSPLLKEALAAGISFPAARARALREMGLPWDLSKPNDILGVEYAKAVLCQEAHMALFPISREGAYHTEALDCAAPSASAIRERLLLGGDWAAAVPAAAVNLFAHAPLHTLEAGERAILAKLRIMSDAEFEALPYGSEGLWRKLKKASRSCANLQAIVDSVKSKRYTRTRIDRMILCAFLGLSRDDLEKTPEYIRALAFSASGRSILREHPEFRNAGDTPSEEEKRLGDLYGLFCAAGVEPPGTEEKRRIFYYEVEGKK